MNLSAYNSKPDVNVSLTKSLTLEIPSIGNALSEARPPPDCALIGQLTPT